MINLKDIPTIIFPDGHKHLKVKLLDLYKQDTVCVSIKSFDDLFLLAQLKEIAPQINKLRINYLLGARCDRRFSHPESLDLRIIADFINGLDYEIVDIIKPHSDVSLALIKNSYAISYTKDLVNYYLQDNKMVNFNGCSVISPDAGASKWIEKDLDYYDIVQCNKHRNLTNGNLESISFSKEIKENCVIVDDLCDGGATFIKLAEQLKLKGAQNVALVIHHGIFSKGLKVFDGLIDHIYCTNSFSDIEDNNKLITQFKLLPA